MRHPPRRTLRRIDSLARRAHAFHRFAHHPLCDAYAPEVLRVGRRARLCRGCCYLYGGAALGVLGGAWGPIAGSATMVALACAVAWLWWTVTRARSGTGQRKLMTRAWPGFVVGWAAVQVSRAPGMASLLTLAIAAVALLGLGRAYRRRGPDRRTCTTCPEFGRAKPCRGFAPIVQRERAFMRLASRWMAADAVPAAANGNLPLVRPRAL